MEPDPPPAPDRPDPASREDGQPDRGDADTPHPLPTEPEGEPLTRKEIVAAPTVAPDGVPPTGKPASAPEPPPPTRAPSKPRALGPYEILGELGRGGMGVVYKAFHPGLKRTVALKVLIAGEDASEEAIARFHREAEAVAKLGLHPNIVPVYDIGQVVRDTGAGAPHAAPLHYFAMHFVDGKPLDKRIDEGAIPPKQAADIARKVAQALQHAHERGVLHRDVKPANILLARPDSPDGAPRQSDSPDSKSGEAGKGGKARPASGGGKESGSGSGRSGSREAGSGESGIGEPMLTDFGLAKDIESNSGVTRSGSALGTPNYMPPEQAGGRLRDVDARSDVYSLGATLYEMLTQRPPFEGDTIPAVLHEVLYRDPVPVRRRNPLVDRDLETICLKCLEKDPARRYEKAGALSRDLEAYLEGSAISARPPGIVEKTLRRARRHALPLSVAALAALLLAVVGAAASALVGRSEQAREDLARKTEQEVRDRRTAEDERDSSRRFAEKNAKAAKVMIEAQVRLGDVHKELKRAYFDSTLTKEGAARLYAERQGKIDAFFDPFLRPAGPGGADGAAAATALALKGWFLQLGNQWERGVEHFAQARKTDPEVGWGYFFEAMDTLSIFFEKYTIPGLALRGEGFKFDDAPPETEALREQRAKGKALAADLGKAAVWGFEVSPDLARSLSALADFRPEDASAIEKAVSDLLDRSEFHWMTEELLNARCRLRFATSNFEGGLEDGKRFLELCPRNAFTRAQLGSLRTGLALSLKARGEDPAPALREAVGEYDAALALDPEYDSAAFRRGAVRLFLADECEGRGEDPRPQLLGAIEDFRTVLRLGGEAQSLHSNLGAAQRRLGDARARFGEDPEQAYSEALLSYDRAIRSDPADAAPLKNRGNLHTHLGCRLAERGEDPEPAFAQAIADYDRALEIDPREAETLVCRGIAYREIAKARAARKTDPSGARRRALEDLAAALRLDAGNVGAHLNLSAALTDVAREKAARGEDPREDLLSAIRSCGEALRLSPRLAKAFAQRAWAYRALAEAEAAAGDPRESMKKEIGDYESALACGGDDFSTHNNLGAACFQLANAEAARGEDPFPLLERALAAFRAAAVRDGRSPAAFSNCGNLLEFLGRYDEALPFYEKARDLSGDPGGRVARKIAFVRQLAKSPEWKRQCVLAGQIYKAGNFACALSLFEKGLALQAGEEKALGAEDAEVLARCHVFSACLEAQLSAGRIARKAEPRPVAAEETAARRTRALGELRRAFERGFADLRTLRAMEDLAPLRSLPEFEALLKEWEEKLAKPKSEGEKGGGGG